MPLGNLTTIARRFLFVQETQGPNSGLWVSFLQRFSGGVDGDSWCADFVSFVLDVAYRGQSPLRRTGSTIQMLAEAKAKKLVVLRPHSNDLYFFVNNQGTPHHVGIVTSVRDEARFMGIAGNTSADGNSNNGTGVFEHQIDNSSVVFVRLP